VAFTLVIQFSIAYIMYYEFSLELHFSVIDAPITSVLVARLFCGMIMHAQTEQYIRFGLNMAKYATNHHEEFSIPFLAGFLGIFYATNTMMISLACLITMCG